MNEATQRRNWFGPTVALSAWLVPGLGHLLTGRWGRALVFFIAVAGLATTGLWMRGVEFTPRSGDPFGALTFLADASTGIFYFLSRFLEKTGPDIAHAAGEYGTRFIATAGVVNLVAVVDAYRIALGRRS